MLCPYCKKQETDFSIRDFFFCSRCFQIYFGIKKEQYDSKYDPYIFHNHDNDFVFIYPNGSKHWYKNGKHHRDNDQPAIIHSNGTKWWYKNGKRHRDNDQPAIIHSDGSKWWYKNDEFTKSEKKK